MGIGYVKNVKTYKIVYLKMCSLSSLHINKAVKKNILTGLKQDCICNVPAFSK